MNTTKKKSTTKRKPDVRTIAARLRQWLDSDQLTGDQRAAIQDAMYDVMDELNISVLNSPEVAEATLSAAISALPGADETQAALDIMKRIEQGDQFKGYLKKKKSESKRQDAKSRELHRIAEVREARSEFFVRVVRSARRGTLAAFGIAENSVCLFEKFPRECSPDEIVLVSSSGNWFDARNLFTYRNAPQGKSIIGRLVAHGQLAPLWNLSSDEAGSFTQSESLKIQEAVF